MSGNLCVEHRVEQVAAAACPLAPAHRALIRAGRLLAVSLETSLIQIAGVTRGALGSLKRDALPIWKYEVWFHVEFQAFLAPRT